jgi:alpha-tubulin suppressor-like RCC1 family protein
VQIGAGEQHTCARIYGGGIKCWGSNYWGQLTGSQVWSSVPVNTVPMGGSAAQLAVGHYGNCIVTAGGGVQCWGIASIVGDGTDVCYNGTGGGLAITLPRWIKNMTSFVTDVAVGQGHACAVKSGGVWCWGDGRQGELGNGETPPRVVCTPVAVTGLGGGVTRVSVGKSHTVALLSGSAQASGVLEDDFGVRAWGVNNLGQLGDGTTTTATTPVPVAQPRFYARLPVVLR